MRFLLDEGLPYRLAAHLQALGHDVTAIGHDYPFALADREILDIATAERRVILTNDKAFGDLVFRDGLRHEGVILFRLGYVPLDDRIALLERAIGDHADRLRDVIAVTHRGIRVRAATAPEPRRQPSQEGGSGGSV
jgi:predicted nuclease of predicted toxin-antitoxin system